MSKVALILYSSDWILLHKQFSWLHTVKASHGHVFHSNGDTWDAAFLESKDKLVALEKCGYAYSLWLLLICNPFWLLSNVS